jgi:hypothetical protein
MTNRTDVTPEVLEALDRLFEELVAYQWKKVKALGERINPRLTDEDLAQPHDFPELSSSAEWNYEDGVLAGYRAAHAAVRARLLRR